MTPFEMIRAMSGEGYVEWVVANATVAKFDVDLLRLLADLAALSRDAKKNGKVKTDATTQ